MALYREDIAKIDLRGGSLLRGYANNVIAEGDILENRYGVSVFMDGEPVSLSGATCIGYFIRSNGDTVVINGGTITGNTAYITLPQACYAYEGRFSLAIKLVGGGVTGTMRIVDGSVVNTTTSTVIDPGSVVPDLTTLLAQISRMEEATEAAEGAVGMIAANYDATHTYALGDIVIHSGKLYRCKTAITTAEAWTASHWEQVTMATAKMTHAMIDAAMVH